MTTEETVEGERKMQLSMPSSQHRWMKKNLPERGMNKFAAQCLRVGQLLHERGLVVEGEINTEAVEQALTKAGHTGSTRKGKRG